jgi:uncharacterized RDD family membrane protein YckC
VELEDRITVATPEGIELTLALAGAGSRFIAIVIDMALQLVLIVLAALAALDLVGGGVGEALLAIAAFAALYLYYILFEVLAAGRTPGKRVTHLRVVRAQGAPVDLPASAIRNLLRLIDLLPAAYLVGLLSILVTQRNQRLGDLAAGTLVIRDTSVRRRPGSRAWRPWRARRASSGTRPPSPAPAGHPAQANWSGWDVSAVSAEELVAVRRFLERRESLDRRARAELAHRLEQGLRAKVAGAPAQLGAEGFLEELARVKATR